MINDTIILIIIKKKNKLIIVCVHRFIGLIMNLINNILIIIIWSDIAITNSYLRLIKFFLHYNLDDEAVSLIRGKILIFN